MIPAPFCRWPHPHHWSLYTAKNIRISTDILWRVFRILTEPVTYAFVSVNRRNNEDWAHIATIPSKTRHKISVDLRIFLQCSRQDKTADTIHPSVCPSVRLFPPCVLNRLTFELDFFTCEPSSPGLKVKVKVKGHRLCLGLELSIDWMP